MRFEPTPVHDAWLLLPELIEDDRGFFTRTFATEELAAHGLTLQVVHANMAGTLSAGTFRGLHRQVGEAAETKLVRCVRGAVHDVVVDVDPDSPTHMQSFGADLTAENRAAMYVPPTCLHGYLTLTDDAEVHYLTSAPHVAAAEQGARHDDPRIGLVLPYDVTAVSTKDSAWPDWTP